MWRTDLRAEEIRDILKDSLGDLFGTWMIIWTERIYLHPNGNILAEVALARIRGKSSSQFDSSKLDFTQLKTKSIPFQLLSLICPGLMIKDGLLLLEEHYDYIKPERLLINVDNTKSTTLTNWELGQKLRSKIGLGRTTIPYNTGRKTSFAGESNVYVIQNSNPSLNAEYIIYPSTELARFYLFRSSRMIEALITPNKVSKKDNVFYDPKSLRSPSEEDPYHFMIIRDQMIVRDIPVLARIAFSQETRMSVGEIQTSLVNAQNFSQLGSAFFLNTFFPFTGETTHEVYGMTLNLGGINVFLVLEITECYKPFPFTSLRFAKESEFPKTVDKSLPPVPGLGHDPKGNAPTGPKPKIVYLYSATFDNDTTRNNRTKNDRKIENAEYVDRRVKYPNLTTDIRRIQEDPVPPKNDNIRKPQKPTSNLSQNQLKGEKTDSTGLDFVSDDSPIEYRTPGNYADRIKQMVDYYRMIGCTVAYFHSLDEDPVEDFGYMDLKVHIALNSDQTNFCKMLDDVIRRVIVFQVQFINKYVLVFEFEPMGKNSYHAFHKTDPSIPFVCADVAQLIESAVVSIGGFANLPKLYKWKRLYHEKTSPKHNAIKILKDFGFYKAQVE